MNIGKQIAEIRKKAGLTQAQLAGRVNVSRSRIKNMESSGNILLPAMKNYVMGCGVPVRLALFDANRSYLYSFEFDSITDELKKIRKKAALTQEELALRMKLSRTRIEQIESGKHDISVRTLYGYISGCGYFVSLDMRFA